MNDQLVQGQEFDAAKAFEDLAQQIRSNPKEKFSGAVAIVAPDGEQITFLVLDPAKNLAQFWSSIQTRVQIKMAELQRSVDMTRTFGR